jgi:hypothetical protein
MADNFLSDCSDLLTATCDLWHVDDIHLQCLHYSGSLFSISLFTLDMSTLHLHLQSLKHSDTLSLAQENHLLMDNMIHFMQHSMGMYGWPLHIFSNLACGLCQLASRTWYCVYL